VVGDAFDLQEQGAQPDGALRHLAGGRLFHGHAVGPGEADVGVAGNPPSELGAGGEIEALEAFFHALVGVAQALPQPEDTVADDGEAEVAWLDSAGMDGADRDLMDALALDADEGVSIQFANDRRREVTAQRVTFRRPSAVAQPLALVLRALSLEAEQVEAGALHAVGLREDRGQIGVGGRVGRQRGADPGKAIGGDEGDVKRVAVAPHPQPLSRLRARGALSVAIATEAKEAVVRAPQGDQLAAFFLHRAGEVRQHVGCDMAAPDMRRDLGEIPVLFADLHLNLPAFALPACTRQPDKAG